MDSSDFENLSEEEIRALVLKATQSVEKCPSVKRKRSTRKCKINFVEVITEISRRVDGICQKNILVAPKGC